MAFQRRKPSDDRRVIERVSNPHLRLYMSHFTKSLMFMVLFSAAIGALAVSQALATESYGYVIPALGAFFLAYMIWSYRSTVANYLENESVSNLDRMLEKQSVLWVSIAFLSVVSTVLFYLFT